MVTTRADLERLGFEGFVRFQDLPDADVPTAVGVYAVLRVGSDQPVAFLPTSPAGAISGRDPSVSLDAVAEAWVTGVEVVYFGKASGTRGLQRRLDAYRRHGTGRSARHWGGRYVWQLADAGQLLVAWKRTPDEHSDVVEARLIREFVTATERRPFANRNLGSSMSSGEPAAPSSSELEPDNGR